MPRRITAPWHRTGSKRVMIYTVLSDDGVVSIHRSIRDILDNGLRKECLCLKEGQEVPSTRSEIEKAIRKGSLWINIWEVDNPEWVYRIQKHAATKRQYQGAFNDQVLYR